MDSLPTAPCSLEKDLFPSWPGLDELVDCLATVILLTSVCLKRWPARKWNCRFAFAGEVAGTLRLKARRRKVLKIFMNEPDPSRCDEESPRWIVAQEGSREAYGVPVAFEQLGCLRLFYADVWCRWGRSWLRHGPAGARALATRHHAGIPSQKVTAFNCQGMRWRSLMSGLQMRIWQSLLIGLAACAVYLTLWSKSNPGAELLDAHILLRLPFFYIVAVFAAFFAHQAREREESSRRPPCRKSRPNCARCSARWPDAAVLTDAAGAIVLHNEAARQFFSIAEPPKGTLAEHLAAMKVEPPLARLLGSSEPSVSFEVVREQPKKLVLAGAASVLKFEAVEGKPAWQGHLFVFRDVTAERQEGLLKRSFLFLISHKLKTPLTLVIGFAHSLLGDPTPSAQAAEFREKAIGNILAQGNKLSGLIEKLLDFIAIEALEPERMSRKSFRLAETVGKAAKSLDPWLKERQAVVELEVDPGLEAFGDEALIQRTFKNLIENGVKFNTKTPKCGAVQAAAQDGLIAVSVRDQGDGIPPEDRQKVFQKFHQVEPSFTGNVEGWGLGLPFVKKVVEFHGGRLSIDSRLNEGTTVSFTLSRAGH